MKVGFIYAGSWEYAYPEVTERFDEHVWCASDDFIFKYPRAVQPLGVEPVFFYLSASASKPAWYQHKYGFPMRRIPVRFGAGIHDNEVSLSIFKELADARCDLLHIYNYYRHRRRPDMYDLLALFATVRRIPFVAHYQGGEYPRAAADSAWKQAAIQPRRLIKRRAMLAARKIFSVSRAEIERLTNPADPEYYGLAFPKELFLYLPNIVDIEPFRPMPRNEACEAIGMDPAGTYLLYVGYLRMEKGVHHLLHVLPGLLAGYPALRLLVVGGGDDDQMLRGLARELGIEKKVIFVGQIPNTELRPYYCAASALVLPTYAEGTPSVLLEALACGTPSVASNVGGIPDVLSDGAGLLVPPRDEEKLSSAILKVLSGAFAPDPEGRKRQLQLYSAEKAGHVLLREYETITE